jgi:hypothetical protein
MEKDITMITRQWRLSLLGGCILLIAFGIPYLFPHWDVYVTQFVRTHLLFIGALLVILLFLLLWKCPQRQVATVPKMKDRLDLELKSRQTLVQILGGAAALGALYFTAQTLRTTQEGQITDRFTKAITQLGDKNLEIRLGGIYALERISKDSQSDHWSVMEVLTAFVRERAPAKTASSDGTSVEREAKKKPPADIQAILTVIGQRERTFENGGEIHHLNLRDTNLQGADLEKAKLHGVTLWGAQLQMAFLKNAQLQGALLRDAQLQDANFEAAQLQGAILWGAQLQKAQNLSQDQINVTCLDEYTQLPETVTKPQEQSPKCPPPPPIQ